MPDCRVPALLLLPLVLSACGGGGSASDGEQPLANVLACSLRNCTESTTLNTDEISMRFTAAQKTGENTLTVSGFVSKSANQFTTVLLQPNEKLSATVDGGPETPLRNVDGQRLDYEVTLPATSAMPVVQLIFTRDGVQHISSVAMPMAFRVIEPVGTPLLARSAGSLNVQLSPMTTSPSLTNSTMQGRCTRKDGSSFDVKPGTPFTTQAGSTSGFFRIDTVPFDKTLNDLGLAVNNNAVGTSLVSRCDLTLTWSAAAFGTSPSTLSKYSSFTASRQTSNAIVYDSWL